MFYSCSTNDFNKDKLNHQLSRCLKVRLLYSLQNRFWWVLSDWNIKLFNFFEAYLRTINKAQLHWRFDGSWVLLEHNSQIIKPMKVNFKDDWISQKNCIICYKKQGGNLKAVVHNVTLRRGSEEIWHLLANFKLGPFRCKIPSCDWVLFRNIIIDKWITLGLGAGPWIRIRKWVGKAVLAH